MDLHRASSFTIQQLTDAYNQTRVDYIVPMPMNAARLREYIEAYDVDLEASWVAMEGKIIFGLGMLGLRSGRSWITRVGVLPIGRRQGTGRAIVDKLIESAARRGCDEVWIEVIGGNMPAQQLFLTSGFRPLRELLVARRPPPHTGSLTGHEPAKGLRRQVRELDRSQILLRLDKQRERPNWLNESESFRRSGDVRGLQIEIEDGGCGWVAYQRGAFQLSHIVVEVVEGDPAQTTRALLQALHQRHPKDDAVMENLPVESPYWHGYQSLGYFEVFRRLEMVKRNGL